MSKIDLSIVILNYNTKKLALEALESIEKNYPKELAQELYEVIIADNGSPDGSLEAFREYKERSKIKLFRVIDNLRNLGFSSGNNKVIPKARGRYILFLNPDTVVYPMTLQTMVVFMDNHLDCGIATCKVETPTGNIDEASHRGFPTPWNAFCHFSGLEKMFPKSHLFSGYIQGWKDMKTTHEVDAVVGAFMLIRREVGDEIGWWDEDYSFYGEDLQFCFDVKKRRYKIYYVPEVRILHYGGVSSGIKKHTSHITTADIEHRKKVQGWRFSAMRTFYKKNYKDKYPSILNWLVFRGIDYLYKRNLPKVK